MLSSMLILIMYGLSKINIKKISLDKANVELEGKEIKLLNNFCQVLFVTYSCFLLINFR